MRYMKNLVLSLGLWGLALVASGEPAYDFFLCANINRNYVVGSKIETLNGVYQRTADDGWQHIGANDTSITAVAFEPSTRQVIYTSAQTGLWRSRDEGRSWRLVNGWDMTEARDLAVDPNAKGHVYLAWGR